MANFHEAFSRTMNHEGGYADDPVDPGGETYRGISRRHHPSWSGWEAIDAAKASDGFPAALDDRALDDAVHQFYKMIYWDRFQGDGIGSQPLAEELFDTGVNTGVHRAVRFLQEGLNLLNRNGASWEELVEDGLIGPRTHAALGACLRADDVDSLLTVMNVLQGMHYIAIMRRNPSQERFTRGWFKRVELRKARESG